MNRAKIQKSGFERVVRGGDGGGVAGLRNRECWVRFYLP